MTEKLRYSYNDMCHTIAKEYGFNIFEVGKMPILDLYDLLNQINIKRLRDNKAAEKSNTQNPNTNGGHF